MKQNDKVVDLTLRARRRQKRAAPPSPPAASGATHGSLAVQLAPTPAGKPKPRQASTRWFSEKHPLLPFRLWEIVYIFAVARRCLTMEEALGWAYRYWAGGETEEQSRTVVDLLMPDYEIDLQTKYQIRDALDEGFSAVTRQGAARLLGLEDWDFEDLSTDDARRLQGLLEQIFQHEGWLLPALPLTLVRLLNREGCRPYDH